MQLIRYASLFGIGIILVKSGLSTSAIGHFESLTFLAGAVSFFWITGIIQSLLPLFDNSKAFGKTDGIKKSPEFFNAFFLLTIFSFLAAVFILISGRWLASILEAEMRQNLVYFIAIYVLLNSPASLLEYIYLLKGESKKLLQYGWIAFGIQFLVISVPALLQLPFFWILTALIASSLLRYVWLITAMRRYSTFTISVPYIRENLALGGPIMVSVLLSGSAQYIDGLIITGYFDSSVFAVFRYGARELPLVALLAHALSSAIIPDIIRKGPVLGLQELRARSSRLSGWLFPVVALFMLSSHVIFPLIYDSGFAESAHVFNVYLLLIISRLVFPQAVLIAYKKTRFLMQASFLELVMNVVLSLIFVSIWGIIGVAYATVIAYVFERIILLVYVKVIMGFAPQQYIHLKRHVLWSIGIIVLFIITELYLAGFLKQVFL